MLLSTTFVGFQIGQKSLEPRCNPARASRTMLLRIDVIFSKEDVETHFHIYELRYAKMQTYAAPVIYGALTIMYE